MELANEDKTYLFYSLEKNKQGNYYLSLQKFQFYNLELSQNLIYKLLNSSTFKDNLKKIYSYTINCVEILKYNLIQCFYDDYYLSIALYNETNLELIRTQIIDNMSKYYFVSIYGTILLRDEISILDYELNSYDNNIYLQIKNIVYIKQNSTFEINNYLNYEKIGLKRFNNKKFLFFEYLNNLIKINGHRFALIYGNKNDYDLFLVIFDINEPPDITLFIRYYQIPLKIYNSQLYNYFECKNYNGFISLFYTTSMLTNNSSILSFFSILSYINGTDSELINLQEGTSLKPKDYINKTNIENNVFGVEFYGIKIILLPNSNENGVFYISKEKNNTINENDILNSKDEIIFIYDYDDLKIGQTIYTIQMAGVVKEALYFQAINYSIYKQTYGNAFAETFYHPEVFIGKTCFYNYTIPNKINGRNVCKDNCKVCYYKLCLKCINNYILDNNTNICRLTIPKEGYYYDENEKYYKKCYESCKTCLKGPKYITNNNNSDIEEMNCVQCNKDFYKLDNTNNCYHKNNPPKYYFFNNEGFSKCYERCMTCSQYKKNSTYYNCLSCEQNNLFYQKSTNC